MLFGRANPNQADGAENNDTLIRKFTLGLCSNVVKSFTLEGAPATYAAALDRAQNKAACEAVVSGHISAGTKITSLSAPDQLFPGTTNQLVMGALTDGTSTPSTTQATAALRRGTLFPNSGTVNKPKCWGCGSTDHFLALCPNSRNGNNAMGRGGGRGGWGRGRARGRGGPPRGAAGGRGGGGGKRRRMNAVTGKMDTDANSDLDALAQGLDEEMGQEQP